MLLSSRFLVSIVRHFSMPVCIDIIDNIKSWKAKMERKNAWAQAYKYYCAHAYATHSRYHHDNTLIQQSRLARFQPLPFISHPRATYLPSQWPVVTSDLPTGLFDNIVGVAYDTQLRRKISTTQRDIWQYFLGTEQADGSPGPPMCITMQFLEGHVAIRALLFGGRYR